MVKFNIGFAAVPLLVTLASVPGSPVVVVPTLIWVLFAHLAPVD
jgi:hypothetical protein